MSISKRYAAVTFAALFLLQVPGGVSAQIQPPVAENEQNEVVNLVKPVDQAADFLTIFRTGDKEAKNSYVSEVIELQNAVAFELLPHVLRAVRLERGTARTLKYADPVTNRERYFIQIVTTREQMPTILDTIRAIDLPGVVSSEGDLKYHYRLNYRRASEVAAILQGTVLSGEGEAFFDDATNTIYFEDSVSDGMRNIETIKFYDVPPPQVQFEVIAVEIDENNEDRLGVDWDAWKRSLGGQLEFTGNFFEGGDDFARLDALLTVDAKALASFLSYTVKTGTARVATRTVLNASNDRPAVFSSLRRLPSTGYVTVFSDPEELLEEVPGVNARETERGRDPIGKRPVVIVPPSRSDLVRKSVNPASPGASALDPSFLNVEKSDGMFLVIQPTIGRTMVTADIRVVVNSLADITELDEPVITERLLTTTVTLENDEPFSLGGLAKDTTAKIRRGIPGLKSIPVLKYLFSVETERTVRSKVYLIIRPRFSSQVLFNSPALNSSKLEIEPNIVLNESQRPAQIPDRVPELFERSVGE